MQNRTLFISVSVVILTIIGFVGQADFFQSGFRGVRVIFDDYQWPDLTSVWPANAQSNFFPDNDYSEDYICFAFTAVNPSWRRVWEQAECEYDIEDIKRLIIVERSKSLKGTEAVY